MIQSYQDRLQERFQQRYGPVAQPLKPSQRFSAAYQEQREDEDDTDGFWDVSLGDVVGDAFMAIPRAAVGAVDGIYQLADSVLMDVLPDADLRVFGRSATVAGALLEGVLQIYMGGAFGVAGKIGSGLRSIGVTNTYLNTVGKYGAVEGLVFRGSEGRLSTVLNQIPGVQEVVPDWLATDDDSEITGRLKNILEGSIVGLPIDAAVAGLRALTGKVKIGEASADLDEALRRELQTLDLNPEELQIQEALGVEPVQAKVIRVLRESMGLDPDEIKWVRGDGDEISVEFGSADATGTIDRLAQSEGRPAASVVRDNLQSARLTPQRVVLEMLGEERPEYLDGVVDFIVKQRDKLRAGALTRRDLAKALITTVMSQQAGAVGVEQVLKRTRAAGFEFDIPAEFRDQLKSGEASVRPEEAASAWMLSPQGQKFLNMLDEGYFDEESFQTLLTVREGFGSSQGTARLGDPEASSATLASLERLDEVLDAVNAAGQNLDGEAIGAAVRSLSGIGVGKEGFIAHLLGFGGTPTLDAVEINYWLTGQGDVGQLKTRAADLARQVKDKVGTQSVGGYMRERVAKRFADLRAQGVAGDLDSDVAPHIIHHWLWDKAKGLETTHAGMYKAQMLAQSAHEAASGRPFGQPDNLAGQPKGTVEFTDDSKAIIRGFESADFSTGVHELAHVARRRLLNPEVPEGKRLGITDDDIRVSEEWSGVVDGVWTRKAEEKFARGLERYITEGVAPNEGLARLFEVMAEFMRKIYHQIKGSAIEVEISPEMRKVFDNLVQRRQRMLDESMSYDLNVIASREAERVAAGVRAKFNPRELDADELELQGIPRDGINNMMSTAPEDTLQYARAVEEIAMSELESAIPSYKSTDEMYDEAVREYNSLAGLENDPVRHAVNVGRQDAQQMEVIAKRAMVRRMLLDTMLTAFKEARSKYTAKPRGERTLKDKALLLRQTQAVAGLLRAMKDVHKAWGRMGRSMQQAAPVDEKSMGRLLETWQARTGADFDDFLDELDAVERLGGEGSVSKTLREYQNSRFWAVLNEVRTNSLISGPLTQIVQNLSAAGMSLYKPLEQMAGSLAARSKWVQKRLLGANGTEEGAARVAAIEKASRMNLSHLESAEAVLDGLMSDFTSFVESLTVAKRMLIHNTGALVRGSDEVVEPKFTRDRLDDRPEAGKRAVSRETASEGLGISNETALRFFDYMGGVINAPSEIAMATTDEFWKNFAGRRAARKMLLSQLRQDGYRGELLHSEVEKRLGMLIRDGQLMSEELLREKAVRMAAMRGVTDPEELERFVLQFVQDNWDPKLNTLSARTRSISLETVMQQELGEGFAKSIQTLAIRYPQLRFFALPFIRTPANLITFGLARSPLGVMRDAAGLVQRLGKTAQASDAAQLRQHRSKIIRELSSEDPQVVIEALGRFTMASSMLMGLGMLASTGALTGFGPASREERKLLEQTGWRPYSIKLGRKYYSYARMDPFATILGFVADLNEYGQWTPESEEGAVESVVMGTALAIAHNLTNKTFLVGVSDLLEVAIAPDMELDTFARRQIGTTLVPSLLAQVNNSADEIQRTFDAVGSQGDLAWLHEAAWNGIRSRTPGLSKGLEPLRNVLGEPVKKSNTTFWDPFSTGTKSEDKLLEEFQMLGHGFTAPSSKRGGLDLKQFTNESGQSAYDRWVELSGQTKLGGLTLRQQLSKLIKTRAYQDMDPMPIIGDKSPRVDAIKRIVSLYQRAAEYEMLKEFPQVKEAKLAFNRKAALRHKGFLSEVLR